MSVRFWEQGTKVDIRQVAITPEYRAWVQEEWGMTISPEAVGVVEIWEDEEFVYLVSFPPRELLDLEGIFSHAGEPECQLVHTKEEWELRNLCLAEGREVSAELLGRANARAVEFNRRAGNLGAHRQ